MMHVLTDDELAQVLRNREPVKECTVRAIERAVVAKLNAQGIDTSPERVEETPKRVHDDVELPPLPEGILNHLIPGHDTAVYTDVQLEAYARAAVLADREKRPANVRTCLPVVEPALSAQEGK